MQLNEMPCILILRWHSSHLRIVNGWKSIYCYFGQVSLFKSTPKNIWVTSLMVTPGPSEKHMPLGQFFLLITLENESLC